MSTGADDPHDGSSRRRTAAARETSGPGDDAALVERCLAGEERAWVELIERHGRLVMAVARRSGLEREAAADLFQDVWTLLAERLSLLRDPAALPKWLMVTTRRLSIRRREESRRLVSLGEGEASVGSLQAGGPAPDRLASDSERHAAVQESLAELSERDRELLRSLFVDETSYKKVARRHGLAVGSLGSLRQRALARLRAALRRRGIE